MHTIDLAFSGGVLSSAVTHIGSTQDTAVRFALPSSVPGTVRLVCEVVGASPVEFGEVEGTKRYAMPSAYTLLFADSGSLPIHLETVDGDGNVTASNTIVFSVDPYAPAYGGDESAWPSPLHTMVWDEDTEYDVGDICTHEGHLYVAETEPTSVPGTGSGWKLIQTSEEIDRLLSTKIGEAVARVKTDMQTADQNLSRGLSTHAAQTATKTQPGHVKLANAVASGDGGVPTADQVASAIEAMRSNIASSYPPIAFDDHPVSGSRNAVTSDGIARALSNTALGYEQADTRMAEDVKKTLRDEISANADLIADGYVKKETYETQNGSILTKLDELDRKIESVDLSNVDEAEGIAKWENTRAYNAGAFVHWGSVLYYSKVSDNRNNIPSDDSPYWTVYAPGDGGSTPVRPPYATGACLYETTVVNPADTVTVTHDLGTLSVVVHTELDGHAVHCGVKPTSPDTVSICVGPVTGSLHILVFAPGAIQGQIDAIEEKVGSGTAVVDKKVNDLKTATETALAGIDTYLGRGLEWSVLSNAGTETGWYKVFTISGSFQATMSIRETYYPTTGDVGTFEVAQYQNRHRALNWIDRLIGKTGPERTILATTQDYTDPAVTGQTASMTTTLWVFITSSRGVDISAIRPILVLNGKLADVTVHGENVGDLNNAYMMQCTGAGVSDEKFKTDYEGKIQYITDATLNKERTVELPAFSKTENKVTIPLPSLTAKGDIVTDTTVKGAVGDFGTVKGAVDATTVSAESIGTGSASVGTLSADTVSIGGSTSIGSKAVPVYLEGGVLKECDEITPKEPEEEDLSTEPISYSVELGNIDMTGSANDNTGVYLVSPSGALAGVSPVVGASRVRSSVFGTIPHTTTAEHQVNGSNVDYDLEPIDTDLKAIQDGGYGITEPMQMGSWTKGGAGMDLLKDIYVCMVDDSGDTVRRLDMWDLTKDDKGEPVPYGDYYRYQIMLAIPKRYVKRSEGSVTISQDGEGDCLAHTLKIGGFDEEFDELLIGMYATGVQIDQTGAKTGKLGSFTSPPTAGWEGWLDEGATGGRRKIKPASGYGNREGYFGNWSREDFRKEYMKLNRFEVLGYHYADREGKNVFMQSNWFHYSLLRDIAVAVMQSTLSQDVYGFGYDEPSKYATDDTDRATAGMCDRLGPFLGHAGWTSSGRSWRTPMKLLVENLWGSIWQYIDDFCVDPSDKILGLRSDGDVDTVPVYAGHSHPDCIGESHDRNWANSVYTVTGDAAVMDTSGRLVNVPEDGRTWAQVIDTANDGTAGVAGKSTVKTTNPTAWSKIMRDIEEGHIDRDHIGDIKVEWKVGQVYTESNSVKVNQHPYMTSIAYIPTEMHTDGIGYGLPANVLGGAYGRPGRGLKDTLYLSPAKRGVAMWGGRSGHGPGSGLFSLSLAPDITNRDPNHGSRIVLLRRKEGARPHTRRAYGRVASSSATVPCRASAVLSVELDGRPVQTSYSIGTEAVTVSGLEGCEGQLITVRYV